MKLSQLLIFCLNTEMLDLKILKIDLQILVNNLQNNGMDRIKIVELRRVNFMNSRSKAVDIITM